MSCNGCRVLKKRCSDDCILRQCLDWIDSPQAQGNATAFVAKYFGRTGLMSFLSSAPASQRQSLFQSLLFEAAGRTVNPVSGAVGLLWTGNWHLCQAAAMTVLQGGILPEVDNTNNWESVGLNRKQTICGLDDGSLENSETTTFFASGLGTGDCISSSTKLLRLFI